MKRMYPHHLENVKNTGKPQRPGKTPQDAATTAAQARATTRRPQGARVEDLKRLVELLAVDYRDIAEVLSGR